MAEWSKALRSGRSPLLWAWVRIPLLTNLFHPMKVAIKVTIVSPSVYLNQNTDSRVAQWKRAGPITQRSVDRNYALLNFLGQILFMALKRQIERRYIDKISQNRLILSGWPSGLRRQTQGTLPCSHDWVLYRDFWSSYEGVGSNPTSDSKFFFISVSWRMSRTKKFLVNRDKRSEAAFSNCELWVFSIQVAWPSGLRRWFKAPVSSEAWVRIPPLP